MRVSSRPVQDAYDALLHAVGMESAARPKTGAFTDQWRTRRRGPPRRVWVPHLCVASVAAHLFAVAVLVAPGPAGAEVPERAHGDTSPRAEVEVREPDAAERSARRAVWEAMTTIDAARDLAARGQDELASLVLERGLAQLRRAEHGAAADGTTGHECPAAASATGRFLGPAKRSLVVALALIDAGQVDEARGFVATAGRFVARYARFAGSPRGDEATAVARAIAASSGDAVEAAVASRRVRGWWREVETWCHVPEPWS